MEIQSEKLDDQIFKNEEDIRKLQERNNKLRKKQQEQEKKEHDKWLSMLDKLLVKEYGNRYPKTLDPEDILKAVTDMNRLQTDIVDEKGDEAVDEDNTKDEHSGEG